MNNHPETSQTQQKAIWYYSVNDKQKGPLTSSAIIQLYKTGAIKKSTLIWRQGLPDWKPLSQFLKISTTSRGTATTNPSDVNTSLKGPILVIVIAIMLIGGGVFGYFRFFIQTPLDGGWQEKNILGITSEIALFDSGKCWIYKTNDKPYSVNYRAVIDGDNSYKVTLSENNRSQIVLISFVDNDTINVSMPGSTTVETMTRINKAMAKSMMGIS